MLEKLFESLDEKVFTAELKESLETQFNDAVETKAAEIAAVKIDAEYNKLNEKSEEHITFLNEKAEDYIELKQTEMLESVDKYLDRVVSDFITEAKASLDESVKSEKADMLVEAFETMLTATGVEVSKIVEAKDESSAENKLTESVEKHDKLIDENILLKEENENLIKMGIISELKEGLSIVESEKFEKLADLIEFSRDEAFIDKLETIKESIKGSIENVNVNEDVNEDDKPAWSHLV